MTAPAVVVAEDSLVIRAVLVEQLQSRGYRVFEAGDGEQALAACGRERPDVVLLDVEMPELDGHAVLARIKADPRLADITVVFVTSRVTVPVHIARSLPLPVPAPAIPPLAVMGIGSWPRPRWMLAAIHDHFEGRLSDAEFERLKKQALDRL